MDFNIQYICYTLHIANCAKGTWGPSVKTFCSSPPRIPMNYWAFALSSGTQRRALILYQSKEMKKISISFPWVGIEPTTVAFTHACIALPIYATLGRRAKIPVTLNSPRLYAWQNVKLKKIYISYLVGTQKYLNVLLKIPFLKKKMAEDSTFIII